MAAEPVVYGASERPPRGDYARARPDYTCTQDWNAYTAQDHDTYRRLYERQSAQLPGLACDTFIAALPRLGARERIPRLDDISEHLHRATGWELVAVPGLIPEVPFFTLLAHRKFPVTDWIRTPEEFDYIVEPDIFHDLFGHVPLLFDPVFADYVQRYGEGGLKAERLGACEMLSRLYWYTIEFGLIRQPEGLRAYGAGILSSAGELRYAVQSPEPQRLPLRLERTMRTRYKIDSFQQTYFVIDSFEQLFAMTYPDFGPMYERLRKQPELAANARDPDDGDNATDAESYPGFRCMLER
ncbi:MAG: phenylalanine 4-monooxygenase [Burkholderiaceae bacterium]|nr:phenylalanine 4-monooxygenase [Burkholderiaceae bacterium]